MESKSQMKRIAVTDPIKMAEKYDRLAQLVEKMAGALEWYANGEHFDGDWENPSGEPRNLLCLAETEEWHWIESGEVAREALKQYQKWKDDL